MVTSCRAGQVWEAWWSTVPSIRSLRRLGGTGMLPVSPACGDSGARSAGGAAGTDIPVSARLWRHSSVITVVRKETCDAWAFPCCACQADDQAAPQAGADHPGG